MIHEQYFYEDYAQYQADFRKKLEQAFEFLIEKGFVSCFLRNYYNIGNSFFQDAQRSLQKRANKDEEN